MLFRDSTLSTYAYTYAHSDTATALTQDSYSLLEATELTVHSQITLLYQEIADVSKEKRKMPRFDVTVANGGT